MRHVRLKRLMESQGLTPEESPAQRGADVDDEPSEKKRGDFCAQDSPEAISAEEEGDEEGEAPAFLAEDEQDEHGEAPALSPSPVRHRQASTSTVCFPNAIRLLNLPLTSCLRSQTGTCCLDWVS